MKLSKEGGNAAVLATGLRLPKAIALDDETIFVVDLGGVDDDERLNEAEGRIIAIQKAGGAKAVLADHQRFGLPAEAPTPASRIASDGQFVYFVTVDGVARVSSCWR